MTWSLLSLFSRSRDQVIDFNDTPGHIVLGFQVVWLGLHVAEDPILIEVLLLLGQEALEFEELGVITNIEAESHSWVDLCIVNLLCSFLVVINMILLDSVQIVRYRRPSVVRVEENQTVLLHAYQEVSLFGSTTNDATIEILHEEGLNWAEILCPNFLQSQTR